MAAEFLHTSHALSPEAVLATFARVHGADPPESWLLCVRGESFELGEPLSSAAARNLEAAWPALLRVTRGAGRQSQ
jgi:Ni,Fe-hydrogenase maturation factor